MARKQKKVSGNLFFENYNRYCPLNLPQISHPNPWEGNTMKRNLSACEAENPLQKKAASHPEERSIAVSSFRLAAAYLKNT
ncbi:MAG: hypothetical protein ACK5M7_19210 [Draconibacterium sp.]